MSDITLSKGIRSNLLNLQRISSATELTQGRLATGKRVNSALDNPTNFFTASSLNSRANDLASLLDNISNGIKTLEAADNGLKAIVKTVEYMQSTVRQARQDRSFLTQRYTFDPAVTPAAGQVLTFTDGAIGTTGVSVDLNKSTRTSAAALATAAGGDAGNFTLTDGTNTTANIAVAGGDSLDTIVSNINAATAAANVRITASNVNGSLVLTNNETDTITAAGTAATLTYLNLGATALTAKSPDELVSSINANPALTGKVRAANVNEGLRIENISTLELSIEGVTAGGAISGGTGAANTGTIGGNSVRRDLVRQFNELRSQLDRLSDDAVYNGINLLRGDLLKLSFNESNTSQIEIQAKDSDGNVRAINSLNLGIDAATNEQFQGEVSLDSLLNSLGEAMGTLRSQASAFGSNLSVVQNRQEFTKSTINTLKTGADTLVLADMNEEAANLLSLQTRQQLANTALSLANQADQGVLRLFG